MATIVQKEADGSNTLKYVPDVPGPGIGGTPLPPVPVKPDTPPAPINRTVDTPAAPATTSTDPATAYLDTFQAPQSAEDIAAQKRKDAQALIDSTNAEYDSELASSKEAGQKRLDQNNALSIISGLAGSTEAVRTDREVSAANQKEQDAVNAKRAVALQTIYNKISDDAQTEAEQQKQDATKSAEDILARRKATQTEAQDNLKLIAQSGQSFDDFKAAASPEAYEHMVDAFGGSEQALQASFIVNRPQQQIVGTPTRVGDHYVQAYKDPVTGKVTMESLSLPFDLPQEYSTFQKLGDNLVAIPDGWDGDTSKLKTIAGSPSTMDRLQQQSLELDIQKKQQDLATATPDPSKAAANIGMVQTAIGNAQKLADASGRSGARKTLESWLVGSTDYTNLEAQVNTIKTNILTLATDPSIKKFFGPQMSNADVTLMTSAGTTLNPELQSPAALKEELGRLKDLMDRMQKSVPGGAQGSDVRSKATAAGYDYDKMKADGHTDAEIEAALNK